MRSMARDYFEANPEIEAISGLRVTGAREAHVDVTVTRAQVMGKPKEFAPDATPAAKVEALARDAQPGEVSLILPRIKT